MSPLITIIFDEILFRWPDSNFKVFINKTGESNCEYSVKLPGYPDRSIEMSLREHGIAILVKVIDNTNPRNTRFEVMSIDHDRLFQRYHGVQFQVDDDSDISNVVDHIGFALAMAT